MLNQRAAGCLWTCVSDGHHSTSWRQQALSHKPTPLSMKHCTPSLLALFGLNFAEGAPTAEINKRQKQLFYSSPCPEGAFNAFKWWAFPELLWQPQNNPGKASAHAFLQTVEGCWSTTDNKQQDCTSCSTNRNRMFYFSKCENLPPSFSL